MGVKEPEPIRIAHIVGKMQYGGIESVVMNYYRHIDRTKVQFDFIADSDSRMPIPRKDEIDSLGGRVFIVPPYQRLYEYIPGLIKLFKEQNYHIVHAHISSLNVFPLYAAKKAGVPMRISHSHTTAAKGEMRKNIFKYTLRPFSKIYATHYAACSKLAGEWLFGKRMMEQGKVTIFHNAIDLDKYRYNEAVRQEVRKELGLESKFVVGHVGRFCYQKNQDFLLDIFAEVYKQNKNAVLLLVGDGSDRKKIEEKARRIDSRKIIFLSNRHDMDRLYQAMDVFLFPSRYEGLGMAAIEAQVCGLKTIVSTAVPKEAKISDNMVFLDLSKGPKIWAIYAMSVESRTQDIEKVNEIYDIYFQARKLAEYYVQGFNARKEVIGFCN